MSDASFVDLAIGPDRDGDLLLAAGDRVVYHGPAEFAPRRRAARRLDCPDATIEPGRVNAHTHIYSGLAPLGMPAPEPEPECFLEILERVWWRLDRALDRRSLRASARLYAAEALLAGTTTLVDHHESPGFVEGSLSVLADACEELGLRAALTYGATERNRGAEEARRGLAECRRFVDTGESPLLRGLVGLHASFTLSDATLRAAGDLCRELDRPLHVHVAEDGADVEDARRRGFPGPLERLIELAGLPPGSILAHGVFLDDDQVRAVAARGAWMVQNPRSNRGNRVGYPPALAASSKVALGTDGYPARMEEEAAVLAELAAAQGEPPEVVADRVAGGWRLAAELFGRPFAPLAAGGMADVAVFEGGRARHVVVGGRVAVEEGTLAAADLGSIRAEAEVEASRLWARLASG